MEIDFLEAPAIGYEHEYLGNRYTLAAVDPYVRKSDGAASVLLTWLGTCAACGEPFFCKSGLESKGLNRRCREHVAPFKASTKEAKKAQRRGRKRPKGS